jgi:hypothetical protein
MFDAKIRSAFTKIVFIIMTKITAKKMNKKRKKGTYQHKISSLNVKNYFNA